ncbi:Trypsin [Eumeta japonica]|uniref:Trypsin n=1 Tax=Eumeta variegata TaxID=151549 RepID=A0A4C1SYW6_EUMVA|nr:Trypsin [Eumeta japonica]
MKHSYFTEKKRPLVTFYAMEIPSGSPVGESRADDIPMSIDRVEGNDNVGIEGGWTIDIESVPYQVSIRFYGEHQCGGVAIRYDYIITGALCLPLSESTYAYMTVLAGTADLKSGGQVYNVSKGMKHERFDIEGLDYDIGLIKLAEPMDSNSKVRLARLANVGPIFVEVLSVRRGGKGGKNPIMGRPYARAHRCVSLSRTKNFLNDLNLQWCKQNTVTPTALHLKRGHFGIVMPSARDYSMGASD